MLKAKIWSVLIFNALTFVKMEKHFNSDLATPHSVLWFWHILYLVYFAHDSFNWYWWAMDICDIYGRLLLPLPPTPGWQFGQAGAKCALNSGHQTHISGKFCTQCVVCCMKKEHVYIYMFCFTACALKSGHQTHISGKFCTQWMRGLLDESTSTLHYSYWATLSAKLLWIILLAPTGAFLVIVCFLYPAGGGHFFRFRAQMSINIVSIIYASILLISFNDFSMILSMTFWGHLGGVLHTSVGHLEDILGISSISPTFTVSSVSSVSVFWIPASGNPPTPPDLFVCLQP